MFAVNGTAFFTVSVRNSGDVSLQDVRIVDLAASGCSFKLGTIGPNNTEVCTCLLPNVAASLANTATVEADVPELPGLTLSDSDDATVTVGGGKLVLPVIRR